MRHFLCGVRKKEAECFCAKEAKRSLKFVLAVIIAALAIQVFLSAKRDRPVIHQSVMPLAGIFLPHTFLGKPQNLGVRNVTPLREKEMQIHTADIGIQESLLVIERKTGNCPCRIVADAGKFF